MERKLRYVWWFVVIGLVILAIWKLFLPHGSNAYLQKTVSSREIVVYVAGAVEKPGLVHLAPDARLDDALKQVSPLPEANLESMNPAEKLKDGQKVSVPYKSLPVSPGSTVVGNSINVLSGGSGNNVGSTNGTGAGSASGSGSVGAGSGNNGSVSSAPAGGKININTAGVAELDKLSGVGPALAQRIFQYRTEHGPFARPEDLENVAGIGTKTFEKMASQVTVSP
ncbi:MAG: helix-hairpin-helix domain-containing protein [Desulfosporosinus sp.]|nr:helix-hairpin-helix domain-containing protein [Desulfosporosinus sp.]